MRKSTRGHSIGELKVFCLYLMDCYIKANPAYEDSRIYIQLKQFYEEGMVKDIIYRNTKLDDKEAWLEVTARKINDFYGVHKLFIRGIKIKKIKESYENKKRICQ